ncbi:MAG: LemA family protein [Nanoarchaeota archaeon]|nr:LemA family protein [Nanoarchaeota archaeon]
MAALGMIIGIVVGLLVIILIGTFVSIYNSLVRLKNNIEKAWANIDVLLKQRTDELGKLLGAVKGFMKQEKTILLGVTKARTAAINAGTIQEKAKADNQLTGALKSLFAVTENYPDLKSNQNFMQLQTRITSIEESLADRREFYNDSVNTFNIRIEQIPYVIIANMLHYVKKEMFKVSEADKKDVKIDL